MVYFRLVHITGDHIVAISRDPDNYSLSQLIKDGQTQANWPESTTRVLLKPMNAQEPFQIIINDKDIVMALDMHAQTLAFDIQPGRSLLPLNEIVLPTSWP
jgi:hypothetical protein